MIQRSRARLMACVWLSLLGCSVVMSGDAAAIAGAGPLAAAVPGMQRLQGPWMVFVPMWWVPVVLGVVAWRARSSWKRACAIRECKAYGYNLLGLDAGSGCPECGTGQGGRAAI
jgi:hypothetical protein